MAVRGLDAQAGTHRNGSRKWEVALSSAGTRWMSSVTGEGGVKENATSPLMVKSY